MTTDDSKVLTGPRVESLTLANEELAGQVQRETKKASEAQAVHYAYVLLTD